MQNCVLVLNLCFHFLLNQYKDIIDKNIDPILEKSMEKKHSEIINYLLPFLKTIKYSNHTSTYAIFTYPSYKKLLKLLYWGIKNKEWSVVKNVLKHEKITMPIGQTIGAVTSLYFFYRFIRSFWYF